MMKVKWFLHETISLLLRFTLIPWFLREIYARHRVTIINYHNPFSQLFEKHLKFYKKKYSIISIDTLAEALASGDWSSLPPKSLVISFDDGYAGNRLLFDALEKYKAPSIIYVVAGAINTSRKFWFNIPPQLQTRTELESMEDSARRSMLEHTYSHTDHREYEDRNALTEEEIRRFIAVGGTIGAHTMFHPVLTKCSKETAMVELKRSKTVIENLCDCDVIHFAYPAGAWNATIREWVQDAGFITARTIDANWVTPTSDILALPNFGISDNAGLNKAIVQSSGLWALLKKISVLQKFYSSVKI